MGALEDQEGKPLCGQINERNAAALVNFNRISYGQTSQIPKYVTEGH